MISIESISLHYGQQCILKNLQLQLGQQGITAIIGPNGAGKTSLLEIIGRLRKPSAGRVLVDGLDVQQAPSQLLATKLAILRQNSQVQSRLKVSELVAFGRFPHCQGKLGARDHRQMDLAIQALGLDDLQHRFLDQLSGGQRQRAFIAMALCQDTPYLLLDEPLNNLDMRHAVDIMRTLKQISLEQDKKIILVLHDLNFAARYADSILAMQQGEVFLHASPEQLLQSQTLDQLYGLPVQVHRLDNRLLADCYG